MYQAKSHRCLYILILILAILLSGFHIATTVHGYQWAQDWQDALYTPEATQTSRDLYFDQMKYQLIFVVAASGVTFFINLILLIDAFVHCLRPRIRHTLAAVSLMIHTAIWVVFTLRAANNKRLTDVSPTLEDVYSKFYKFYRLAIASAAGGFAIQVIYFLIIFQRTLWEVEQAGVPPPAPLAEVPLSNRYM